jgi:hypothetical protein
MMSFLDSLRSLWQPRSAPKFSLLTVLIEQEGAQNFHVSGTYSEGRDVGPVFDERHIRTAREARKVALDRARLYGEGPRFSAVKIVEVDARTGREKTRSIKGH